MSSANECVAFAKSSKILVEEDFSEIFLKKRIEENAVAYLGLFWLFWTGHSFFG